MHFLESAKKVLAFLGPSSVLIICYFIGYESRLVLNHVRKFGEADETV